MYQIFVNSFDGSTITLDVESSDTIDQVKAKIEEKRKIPLAQQKLTYADRQLENKNTLFDYKIRTGFVLSLDVCTITVSFKMLTGRTVSVNVKISDTIEDVKAKLQEQTGYTPREQRLVCRTVNGETAARFYNGAIQLMDGHTLYDYKINENSEFHLVYRGPIGPCKACTEHSAKLRKRRARKLRTR